jgi:hypothetical protein
MYIEKLLYFFGKSIAPMMFLLPFDTSDCDLPLGTRNSPVGTAENVPGRQSWAKTEIETNAEGAIIQSQPGFL